MKITVAGALRPFSHTPGTSCLIPFSAWKCTAFPAFVKLENIINGAQIDLFLSLSGPIKEFTIQQDLEAGLIKVFGFAKEGYFRYRLEQKDEGLYLQFEKVPAEGMALNFSGSIEQITAPTTMLLCKNKEAEVGKPYERLSLGQSKSQEWSGIKKRSDLAEIFPHWLRLGQLVPATFSKERGCGMLALLQRCQEVASSSHTNEVIRSFTNLFLAGFSGMMVPRLKDEEHQGIVREEGNTSSTASLQLLSEGANAIRSLFFQEKDGVYHLLPCLPSEFHCGRLLGLMTKEGDCIDLEWSKKLLRRAIIRIGSERELSFSLQKELKRFRMKKALSHRGTILDVGTKIHCLKGDVVYLDNFQK
jgi:hypothetical protein